MDSIVAKVLGESTGEYQPGDAKPYPPAGRSWPPLPGYEAPAHAAEERREVQIGYEIQALLKGLPGPAQQMIRIARLADELINMHKSGG
jgi:hypothetical protein